MKAVRALLLCLVAFLSGCLLNSPFDDSVTETNNRLFWSVGEVGFTVGGIVAAILVALLLLTKNK